MLAALRGNGDIGQSMENDGWRKAGFEIRQWTGRAYGGFITSRRQQRGHVFFTKLDERVECDTRGELRVWRTGGRECEISSGRIAHGHDPFGVNAERTGIGAHPSNGGLH